MKNTVIAVVSVIAALAVVAGGTVALWSDLAESSTAPGGGASSTLSSVPP